MKQKRSRRTASQARLNGIYKNNIREHLLMFQQKVYYVHYTLLGSYFSQSIIFIQQSKVNQRFLIFLRSSIINSSRMFFDTEKSSKKLDVNSFLYTDFLLTDSYYL